VLYRSVLESAWEQGVTSKLSSRLGYVPTPEDQEAECATWNSHCSSAQLDEEHMGTNQLEHLDHMASVTATDRASLIKAAKLFPALLSMSVNAVVARMLLIKQLFPGAARTQVHGLFGL
jgi:hypothetical protein